MKKQAKKKKPVIYQAKSGEIKFRGDFEHENLWGTQADIVKLFGKDQSVISRHIRNIFKDGEVSEKSNMQKMHIANSDKPVTLYSLDVLLAVGYRTNSAEAIKFRRWTTNVLKKYTLDGFVIDKKKIVKNHEKFVLAMEDIQKLLPVNGNVSTDDILALVKTFAGTWFSLESYDEDKFPQKGFTKKRVEIQSEDLYDAVAKLKRELMRKKQATSFFAQEKASKSLEGIVGNVCQSVFGKEVYPTVEEKAAHLLYFVVKNHPFTDGNKRTGALSFIWFLQKSGVNFKHKITPEALTAITLLVAESKPKEKDRMIGLILLLLKK